MAEQTTKRKGPGRPRTGRDADFTVAIKPDLKVQFKRHCKTHNLNVSKLFEDWVQDLMSNPAQPELTGNA